MKFSKILVSAASVALIIVPQIALARTPAKSKYLANVERIVKKLGDPRLTRTHATTSTSYRLQYGYGICQALDRGATINDLTESRVNNSSVGAFEKMYEITMQSLAIYDLCPEYKLLLSK